MKIIIYYMHWRGVSLIESGNYAEGGKVLNTVAKTYPDTRWGKRSAEYLGYIEPIFNELVSKSPDTDKSGILSNRN